MSTWKKLESGRLVRRHRTSTEEISVHFDVVDRNLQDAAVSALSDDGRFFWAYQAAFQLSTIVLFASGYEACGDDHHKTTFSALPLAMGAQITMMSDYFDRCRRKRNNIQYDQVNVATKSEVDELIAKAEQFRKTVIEWLKRNYPKLLPVGDSGGGS